MYNFVSFRVLQYKYWIDSNAEKQMRIWIWPTRWESVDEHGLLQNAMTNQHLHSLYINKMTSLEDRQSTKSHPRAKKDKFYKEKYNKTDTNLRVCPKWTIWALNCHDQKWASSRQQALRKILHFRRTSAAKHCVLILVRMDFKCEQRQDSKGRLQRNGQEQRYVGWSCYKNKLRFLKEVCSEMLGHDVQCFAFKSWFLIDVCNGILGRWESQTSSLMPLLELMTQAKSNKTPVNTSQPVQWSNSIWRAKLMKHL